MTEAHEGRSEWMMTEGRVEGSTMRANAVEGFELMMVARAGKIS